MPTSFIEMVSALFFAPSDISEIEKVLTVVGPIALGLILALAIYLYCRKKANQRMLAMQQAAAQLGWTFAAKPPMNYIAGLDRFTLFTQGHSKQILNMMYGEANGIKAAVFDYVYTTGSGKNATTHYQTVAYLEPPNINLPYFSLRPESLMSKVFSAFGYQDIDFGQRPVFSKEYLLRGQDEQGIRGVFNDSLLSFYEGYQGICTDAGGNQILLFRANTRLPIEQIQSYLGLALSLLNFFPHY